MPAEDVTLRDYLEGALETLRRDAVAFNEAASKAIDKAEALSVERVEAVRREAVALQQSSMLAVSKAEELTDRRFGDLQQQFATWSADVSVQLAVLAEIKAGERLQLERVEAVRREADAALRSASEAIAKQERATETRFASVNEFRAQLNDQANLFMPRTEVDAANARYDQRINVLSEAQRMAMGREESLSAHARTAERLTDLTTGLANTMTRSEAETRIMVNTRAIQDLTDRLNLIAGKGQGTAASWSVLVAVVGLIATALVIYSSING